MGDWGIEGGNWGGGDVTTFVGTRRALREPVVHAAAHVGAEWRVGDLITFVGMRRALHEPSVHAGSLPCHDAFRLCFAFESGGAFSVAQRVHTSSKRKPLQELIYKHMYIYIYICVNKHSVAYQDVDVERGVLGSVMRAKRRCSIHSHDTKRPHTPSMQNGVHCVFASSCTPLRNSPRTLE